MNNSVQNLIKKKKKSMGKETTQEKEFQRENAYHSLHHVSRSCSGATWLSGSFISLDHFFIPCSMEMWEKKKILCRGPEISERCANMEMCNRHIFPLWRNYEESKGRKCLTGICRKKNGDHHRGKWGIKGEEWGLDRNLIWNGTEVLQCWKKNDDTMEKGRKRK